MRAVMVLFGVTVTWPMHPASQKGGRRRCAQVTWRPAAVWRYDWARLEGEPGGPTTSGRAPPKSVVDAVCDFQVDGMLVRWMGPLCNRGQGNPLGPQPSAGAGAQPSAVHLAPGPPLPVVTPALTGPPAAARPVVEPGPTRAAPGGEPCQQGSARGPTRARRRCLQRTPRRSHHQNQEAPAWSTPDPLWASG